MIQTALLQQHIDKWQDILRLRDWDIRLTIVDCEWRKTGDIKIDEDDKKAVLLINGANPKQENLEEVIIHELLHLKLWGMDQMLEQLLGSVFGQDENDPKYDFAQTQFMALLESTVEDLAKGFLALGGSNKELSFGRVHKLVAEELRKGEPEPFPDKVDV
ncbi:MAG TPA: hypothetical protein VLM78_04215, partial [Anaerolineales bacterium]|nr:hypothetical protein [Anaerolineales bacterium]